MLIPWFRKKEAADTQEESADAGEPGVDAIDEQDDEETEDEEEDEWEDEEDDSDSIRERVNEWGREWSETPAFEALPREQKSEVEFIVESFAEYMYSYHGVAPEQWNVADMEECCLDTLPRKISAEETYFRALAPVLASFFTFLGKTGRLRNASKMAQRVLALDKRIVAASNDPRNWGMAKSFVMDAKGAGVDLENEQEMAAFTILQNARAMGRIPPHPGMALPDSSDAEYEPEPITFVREGPKIGRNDPCPCGSGKKYKKCCGSS